MKPLLRAVLIIDAVLLLAFGVLFVLTPWQALFNALQLANIQPAMLGQAFGIALLGLAWLAFHAAVNGELTAPVARAVGHVNWLIGVLTVVWSIGTGNGPALAAAGRVLSAVAGARTVALNQIWAARAMGSSEATLLWRIVLRAALPSLMSGLRVAVPTALLTTFTAEMVAGGGLGGALIMAQRYFESATVYAYLLVMLICGYLFDVELLRLRRKVLHWYEG